MYLKIYEETLPLLTNKVYVKMMSLLIHFIKMQVLGFTNTKNFPCSVSHVDLIVIHGATNRTYSSGLLTW
jgi:hypothetical protein